jgi:glycosyltransferase involved in cell wall biosynthesis
VTWLFQGDISNGRIRTWHNSTVILCGKIKGNYWYTKLVNKVLAAKKLFHLLRILRRDDIKIVLIRDLPFLAVLAAPLKSLFKFKLYFQYTAPLGDINIGFYKIKKTIDRYWYLFNGIMHNFFLKLALKVVDIIFPINEFHEQSLISHTYKEKFIPVTMGIDEDWLQRQRKKIPFLSNLREEYFFITYFGTLNIIRKPQFILEVFARVKIKCPKCKLIMIGRIADTSEKIELESICRNLGIDDDVIFTGYIL